MDKNIIYLKETSSYSEILQKEHNKMPLFFKKICFLYKNVFNIITKKKVEEENIWVLPIKDKYSINKLKKLLRNDLINHNNIYVVSEELRKRQICDLMDQYEVEYVKEEKVKKVLLIQILNYLANLHKKDLSDFDLTLLVNNTSSLNMFLIEEISKKVKTLKVVSLNIYKFKKLEEKLYNEYGIPMQFSNSYKKSLEKSRVIVNLDFNNLEINEYEIYDKAIIINCTNNCIKIKSRLFNGIVINSYNIELEKDIVKKFKQMRLYDSYNKLLLYASTLENKKDFSKLCEELKNGNITINNLIGNNGIINKKEFKNIFKKLDKNKKTE